MNSLIELDKKLFLLLNSLHTQWLDQPMYVMTKLWAWTPLYLVLLWLIFRDYRHQAWIILLAIALTLLVSDQLTSHVMKPLIGRLRPTHDPALQGIVHIVNGYRGGAYGFASGHAANTFGLATLFFLLLRPHYRSIKWIFVWATIMTYTRIYLGVHFPGDIIAGAVVGIACAWIIFRSMRYYTTRYYLEQRIFK